MKSNQLIVQNVYYPIFTEMAQIPQYRFELPTINGEPTVGIAATVDEPDYSEIRLAILYNVDNETAATYAACHAYMRTAHPDVRMNQTIAAASAYAIVKYGLFGYILEGEKDGRWDIVDKPSDDVAAVREACIFSAEDVRDALSYVLATKVSYWSTNHHVGQEASTGYLKKLRAVKRHNSEQDRAAIHAAGHWAGTLRILRKMGINGLREVYDYGIHFPIRFRLSDDFQLRVTGLPAGVGKLGIARALLQRMVRHPAMRICPDIDDFTRLAEVYRAVLMDRASFHIGAYYLTGRDRSDIADSIQTNTLGRLGAFASVFYSETSLFKSPCIAGVERKKYKDYEDYDAEFLAHLGQLKKVKIPDTVLEGLLHYREVNNDDLIDEIARTLVEATRAEEARAGRGSGPVVNIPRSDPANVI